MKLIFNADADSSQALHIDNDADPIALQADICLLYTSPSPRD